ncbi:MAG: shikimate dehydrogenase [Legionella sp.]|nr:shikimate dehydrogenase [Legionella sp.]
MATRFAVIGDPIDHSLSPFIHQCFASQTHVSLTYEKIKGESVGFEMQVADFFKLQGSGLNITLPFKQRAFAMARQATDRCKQAKAGNTLWLQTEGLWVDNTDGVGLIRDLLKLMTLKDKRILIVGAGGAARGIISPLLEEQPASLVLANRTGDKLVSLSQDFPMLVCTLLSQLSGTFDLVINATSASLQGESIQLPAQCLKNKPLCYDLSYKLSVPTPFVMYAKSQGCPAQDGLGMLVEQAAEAFFIWNKVMPDTEEVLIKLRKIG